MKKRRKKSTKASRKVSAPKLTSPKQKPAGSVTVEFEERQRSPEPDPIVASPKRDWIGEIISKPRSFILVSSIFILLGFCGGLMQGHLEKQRSLSELKTSYIDSLDPYVKLRGSR